MKYKSCTLKTTQVIVSVPKCWQFKMWPWPFDPKTYTYLPLTILHLCKKIKAVHWKLLKLSRQKQSVDKIPLWHWPLDPKIYIDIFSPSCIYVWNMKAVRWQLLKLLFQNQSVDKIPFWPWPFDPKIYRYLPLTILHLCMKYESCTLKITQVIVSEPKCWLSSVATLTFWSQNVWVSSSHHPASMYEISKLYVEIYSSYYVRTKVFTMFRCEFDLLTPECIGIFLSPSCIYVWNTKAVRWKLLKLSCQNQSVDKVQLWPWPLDPKMYMYLPLIRGTMPYTTFGTWERGVGDEGNTKLKCFTFDSKNEDWKLGHMSYLPVVAPS